MKTLYKLQGYFVIALLAISLFSCTKGFESINQDPTKPTEVTPAQLITGIERTASDIMYSGGVNDNIGMLYAQYFSQTQTESQSQYQLDEAANNLLWTSYSVPLSNIQELLRINELKPEPASNNQNAIAKILSVWIYQVLTDTYGNIPFSEALRGDELILTSKYDDSKTIYDGLITLLNQQISALDATFSSFRSGELIYQGDVNKWKKLANALKIRIGLRMVNTDPAKAKQIIEEASANTFTAIADEAKFPYQPVAPDQFPYNDQDGTAISNQFFVSATLVDFMKETGDPRLPMYARDAPATGTIVGKPYGLGSFTNINEYSRGSAKVYSTTFPGYIISYAEVQFALAEAAARGFNVGGDAATFYENGIRASMQFWGVGDADIAAFLTANPYDQANWKNIIGPQKWVALYNQGLQGWFERTRLNFTKPNGDPFFRAPNTILDNTVTFVPYRITYPLAEMSNNAENYNQAKTAMGGDNKGIKLWWQD
ncbi:MAG: SusD/RagB family nutrient-binding outer membrane lipoprotein [Chitinophagaceae bacterium]|nr:SusD/RagB family nutrient-binding outer membrane lipoprotein [Chitinophagaceae bacterium]